MENRKMRVGIVTSPVFIKTGFSTFARALLPYLYKTGKYELFHLNQSVHDNHPDFARFAWHNEGVFKAGTFDEQRFNHPSEDFYRRHVSYGNLMIESFITKNKLDAVIHTEDIWSASSECYLNSRWWKHMKNNFLQHSTADSLPILPLFKEWAEKCPSMWFWSSFAERALKAEDAIKYGHVKTVPGCINTDHFHPITNEEKINLRREFNIDLDTKIILKLGRLQLRKLFPSALEALAKFRKLYPNEKLKLFFHTKWSEPGGFPLERLIIDFGLKKEDVLTTYFCRHCGKWEIKPYTGEEQNCKYCGAEKSQLTAGVDSTVSDKDLSKIYGIADAALNVHTSGGFEYHGIQSLLCGLPLMISEYSCGEDYVANDFVFRLDGSNTYESGTGFIKAAPNINTIVSFYKTICDLPEEKRLDLSKRSREWSLKVASVNNAGKQYEEWLDSRKPIEWDYQLNNDPKDLKNPSAIIPDIQDDGDYILECYKRILNMNLDKNDSGYRYWLDFLSK